MNQTWDKVRSFFRPPLTGIDTPVVTQRELPAAIDPPPRDDGKLLAIESKAGLLASRVEALEIELRNRPPTPSSQPAIPSPDAAMAERLAALSDEVDAIREQLRQVADQHAGLQAAAADASQKIAVWQEAIGTLDKRVDDTTKETRQSQRVADEALGLAENVRDDLQRYTDLRGNEIGQRMAPLYVLNVVTLLIAFAAVVLAIVNLLD